MKRFSCIIMLLLVPIIFISGCSSNSEPAPENDGASGEANGFDALIPLNEASWGMKQGDFIRLVDDYEDMGSTIKIELDSEITPVLSVIGMNYRFDDNSLVEVMPIIAYYGNRKTEETGDQYDQFIEIQKYLESIFGEPDAEEFIWHNDTYQDDRVMWDKAFSHIDCYAKVVWILKDQKVTLNCSEYITLFFVDPNI